MVNKKGQRVLLILDSGSISAFTVKEKDSVMLQYDQQSDARIEVGMNNSGKIGLTESTKYLFNLAYPSPKK